MLCDCCIIILFFFCLAFDISKGPVTGLLEINALILSA